MWKLIDNLIMTVWDLVAMIVRLIVWTSKMVARFVHLLSHMKPGLRKTFDVFTWLGGAVFIPLLLKAMVVVEWHFIMDKHVHTTGHSRLDYALAGLFLLGLTLGLAIYGLVLLVRVLSAVWSGLCWLVNKFWDGLAALDLWFVPMWVFPKRYRQQPVQECVA